MEADLAFLRILGVVGMAAWFGAMWTTGRYFAQANGQRPLVMGLFLLSVLATLVTYGLAWTMFRRTDSITNGWMGWSLYSNRVSVILMAWVVWWTGRRIFR